MFSALLHSFETCAYVFLFPTAWHLFSLANFVFVLLFFLPANRAAEVNEMWRVRKKELELDDRLKGRLKDESRVRDDEHHSDSSEWRLRRDEADEYASGLSTSSKQSHEDYIKSEDRSLRDEEIEEFLHSRS